MPHGYNAWRHPDNALAWWAERVEDNGSRHIRWTYDGVPLVRPSNFGGGARIVLTTAHVYDDRPEAASLLNLAALCQLCHNRHDAAKRRAGTRARRIEASGQCDFFNGDKQ